MMLRIKNISLLCFLCAMTLALQAQPNFYQDYTFTRADTLRGMLRPERTCYDVTFYKLHIKVEPDKKYVSGYVDIEYHILENFTVLQIDLYKNMNISRIEHLQKNVSFKREFDAVFVTLPRQKAGGKGAIRVHYEGTPTEAQNPPWDGGFVWATDNAGKPWVGVACEGEGASLWWPNKDHLSDEPDSVSISVAVPNGLMCVANGRLRSTVQEGNFTRYEWFVSYPINNYNVTVNIAHYAHFSDTYTASDGEQLSLDYYVLPVNERKAKTHFKQVPGMLACYERYFDKYPFWRDGYKLVETPYLGMEHQSAIAYGNRYMRGYLGGMIPAGQDWDYIIIHETGHEYFGNSISCNDLAEMWIHESFTTYMESLYIECIYGYAAAEKYLVSQLSYITNQEPILGPPNVNWDKWKGSDHYHKGAWILHTLRHTLDDDQKWFDLLKGFYNKYKYSTVNTADFINYVNIFTGKDYAAFFEQYLQYSNLPVFAYEITPDSEGIQLKFRWETDVKNFNMPLKIGRADNYRTIYPTNSWKTIQLKGMSKTGFKVPTERYLINVRK